MIYFSYGMVKSASTYCCFLVRQILQEYANANGKNFIGLEKIDRRLSISMPYEKLYSLDPQPYSRENICYWLDENLYSLDQFYEIASSKLTYNEDFLVAKTHESITPVVRAALGKDCFACATYRHPADMALSLMDAARLDKARGLKRFIGITNMEIALNLIDDHINRFIGWKMAGAITISFEKLALNPRSVVRDICQQLEIEVDPQSVMKGISDKYSIPEYNIGRQNRRYDELSDDVLAVINERYSDFLLQNEL